MRPTPEMVRAIEARVRAMVARLRAVADRRGATAVDVARGEAAERLLRFAEVHQHGIPARRLRAELTRRCAEHVAAGRDPLAHADAIAEALAIANAAEVWEDTLVLLAGLDRPEGLHSPGSSAIN